MPNYEIRLHKADNTLSIVMATMANDDTEAKVRAAEMLKDDVAYAAVWRDSMEIAIVRRRKSY